MTETLRATLAEWNATRRVLSFNLRGEGRALMRAHLRDTIAFHRILRENGSGARLP